MGKLILSYPYKRIGQVNENRWYNQVKIKYPSCGKAVEVNGLGRKRLNIPPKDVYELLKACQ